MTGKKTKNKGFTFVELLVANMVAVLAIGILFYVSLSIQKNIGITTETLGISEKGRYAINHISQDIREASFVASSHSPYATNDTTLILKLPAIYANGDVIMPIEDFDYVTYTLDSANPERLLRIVDADPVSARDDISELITQSIDTLLFSSGGTGLSYVGDKSAIKTVTVKITTKGTSAGLERQNKIGTSASLRNR